MEIDWIESNNYKTLIEALTRAYENHQMVVVLGNEGWGKSAFFKLFASQNPNVFVDEIDASMDTTIFFNEMLSKFNIKDRQTNKVFYAIRDNSNVIKKLNTKSMYIIDEAGNFKMSMLRYIRDFWKHIKENSALVLAGPYEPFYRDLQKYAEKNKYGTREFMSRVDVWIKLKEPSPQELVGVFKVNGFNEKQIPELVQGCKNFRDVETKIKNYWIANGITPKLRKDGTD